MACLALAAMLPAARSSVVDELERGVGCVAARALEDAVGVWQGPETASLLAALTADLFPLRSRRFPYHLSVLRSYQLDALCLPGGHIYLLRGLLAHANSVDELAAVLAHEMGHLEDRDFERYVGRELLWLSLAGWLRRHAGKPAAQAALVAGLLNTLRHSRRQEAQADGEAVRFCWLAGYQPDALLTFLGRLRKQRWRWIERIFQTHPDPVRREELVAERVAALLFSQPRAAWRLCQALERRGRPVAAYALARQCLERGTQSWWAEAEAARLAEKVHSLASLRLPSPAAGGGRLALAQALEDLEKDARLRRALTIAQAVDPELYDLRYLGAFGYAVRLLMRLQAYLETGEEAVWRWGGVCAVSSEGRRLAERAGQEARHARQAGWMVAAVLAELVGSGPGQPLDAISAASLAMLWGQLKWADRLLADAEGSLASFLHWVTKALAQQHLEALQQVAATEAGRQLLQFFAAVRPGPPSSVTELLRQWEDKLHASSAQADNIGEDLYLATRLASVQAAGEIRQAQLSCRAER
jgi:hypothetical protein